LRYIVLEKVDRAILEEIVIPEGDGVLASKRYITTAAGAVLKETRVAFCDRCGRRLEEGKATILCCVCSRKLCDSLSQSCAIEYRGRHYCEDDLQQLLPLDRLQWKIIHGLMNELRVDEIKDLSRSKDDEFHSALNELRVQGYLEKKGLSLFSRYEVLDQGILAWKTYQKSFNDGDIEYFVSEAENHVMEIRRHVKRED
jgi:hypothetical protein